MALLVLMHPEFHQVESGKVDGSIGVVALKLERDTGDLKAPMKVMQNLVSYEGGNTSIQIFSRVEIDDDLVIYMVVNEEGLYFTETPLEKVDNGEKLSETELKWIPWPSPIYKDLRSVAGNIVILKEIPNRTEDDGEVWCCLEEDDLPRIFEYINEQRELKLAHFKTLN